MRAQVLSRPQFFDARAYALCKPFLRSKDRWLGSQIAAELAKRAEQGRRVRVLDVGTGEGVILRQMLQVLKQNREVAKSPVSVTCIEPERLYRSAMESLQEDLRASCIDCTYYSGTLERYLEESGNERFHVATATHTMYHFARSSWTAVVDGLQSRLGDSGIAVIQIVSRDSTVQRLGRKLTMEAVKKGIERTFDVSGFDICAEDLADELRIHGLRFDYTRSPAAPLAVGAHDYATVLAALDEPALATPAFMEFLAFMLRLPVDALRGELRDATRSLVRLMQEEHPPLTIDGVITIHGDTP